MPDAKVAWSCRSPRTIRYGPPVHGNSHKPTSAPKRNTMGNDPRFISSAIFRCAPCGIESLTGKLGNTTPRTLITPKKKHLPPSHLKRKKKRNSKEKNGERARVNTINQSRNADKWNKPCSPLARLP